MSYHKFRPYEHGHPAAYEPLGLPKKITITLYDLWTKLVNGSFEEVNVRSEGCEVVYEKSADFQETYSYLERPMRATNKILMSEDSRVPESVIQEEWDPDNEARFDRKPIGTLEMEIDPTENDFARRFEGKICRIGPDFHNIVIQLKSSFSSTDEGYITNADRAYDKEGKFTTSDHPSLEDAQYYKKTNVQSKFYVKVRETGCKTVCHYFGQDPSTQYSLDWVEGIFFSPFDTSDVGDDGNFKVTTEPDYEADEVTCKVSGDIEVYLAPRRWAFVSRGRKNSWVDPAEFVEMTFPVTVDYSLGDFQSQWSTGVVEDLDSEPMYWFRHENPQLEREPQEFLNYSSVYPSGSCIPLSWCSTVHHVTSTNGICCKLLINNFDVMNNGYVYDSTTEVTSFSCSGRYTQVVDPAGFDEAYDLVSLLDCEGDIVEMACPANYSGVEGFTHTHSDQTNWHRHVFWSFEHWSQDFAFSYVYTLTSKKMEQKHIVAIWWDRFPIDEDIIFETIETGGEYSPASEIPDWEVGSYDWFNNHPPPSRTQTIKLITETIDSAKTNLESAGGSEEEVNQVFSGMTNIHTFSCAGSLVTKDDYFPDKYRDELDPNFSTEYLENKILFDDCFSDNILVSTKGYDNWISRSLRYPSGVGLSPDKEGSLVGVIVEKRKKVFYVWRKKDEEFDIKTLPLVGDYAGHQISFYSNSNDGNAYNTFGKYEYYPIIRKWAGADSSSSDLGIANPSDGHQDIEFVDPFWAFSNKNRLLEYVGAKADPANSVYKKINTGVDPRAQFYNQQRALNVPGYRNGTQGNSNPLVGTNWTPFPPTNGGFYPYDEEDPAENIDQNIYAKYYEGGYDEDECGDSCGVNAEGISKVIRNSGSEALGERIELSAPILYMKSFTVEASCTPSSPYVTCYDFVD